MNAKRIAPALILALALGSLLVRAQQAPQQPPSKTLKVGDPAPDFTLQDQDRNKVTLSGFRGKQSVVLAFYVLAFTGG
jgi:cytochrome oxidase Cu insertion factor (SCO1/SenC/PrrC family)